MERIWRDVRLALRSLRRSPTFTATTIAILALGIGMSTAMFTVYKTVLIDRLPIVGQDRLIVMHPIDRHGTHLDAPYPYLATMARDSALFRGIAGVYHLGAQPGPFMAGTTSIQLATADASANFFDVFGMRPAVGRLFRTEDGHKGAPLVMVLTYAAWRRQFGRQLAARSWSRTRNSRVIGAVVAGRLLASQLFGVSPIDPVSIASAATALLATGVCAAYVPARRATRIDPVEALRAE